MNRTLVAVSLLAAIAVAVGGCREGETGRPLEFKPGHYSGAKDQKLDEAQRKALIGRAGRAYQGQ